MKPLLAIVEVEIMVGKDNIPWTEGWAREDMAVESGFNPTKNARRSDPDLSAQCRPSLSLSLSSYHPVAQHLMHDKQLARLTAADQRNGLFLGRLGCG